MTVAAVTTTVHVIRHGEVENPEGVLYGRLPDFHLSPLGRQMAEVTADYLAPRDIVHVVASPLERAQETAEPIAHRHGLAVRTDARVVEAANHFQGTTVASGGVLHQPQHWAFMRNPFRPSWGEPYRQIATRMMAALTTARMQARGHEAVVVSHQLPVWTLRRQLEGRRLWHDPRRRECTLASVTSVRYEGDDPVEVSYAEPAGHLLAAARPGAGA
ncbi:MAG TPA: histidine phosphatase family protein [Ornithinimicrobium sp.]|uniref:histidine phosphatase family protein n=1 Tax=Ornithinimicrobium sp. TaxID=1977084 RepID=UPI002B497531|nr:histidine phosphatase family protein [Ornithinimicrobium sp.]HKJ12073.1 histidine phosphatase family protein [Ornithinimicrobium sp.]